MDGRGGGRKEKLFARSRRARGNLMGRSDGMRAERTYQCVELVETGLMAW